MSQTQSIQLVIPMAGLGKRFTECGYTVPKPLINIHGLPMYRLVLADLLTDQISRVAIVAQRAWNLSRSIDQLGESLGLEIALIEIDYVTDGPADTVQLTEEWLHPGDPVVTANSDQYVDADIRPFYSVLTSGEVAGGLLLMEDSHPKWSYARLNEKGYVIEVREKSVISPFATVGIYGFATASIMLDAFAAMRARGDRVNGEFYVGPSYNYLRTGFPIAATNLGPVSTVMHGLGTPEDFESFRASDISRHAVSKAITNGMPT